MRGVQAVTKKPCPHWHAEVERLRAESSELCPAARIAVREVLVAVLTEDSLDPQAADSARSLLAVLGRPRRARPVPSPDVARPSAPGRAGSRLLAIARGHGRLASTR